MKKLFLATFVALLAINLSSCEDGTDPTTADIVGSWQLSHEFKQVKVNTVVDDNGNIDRSVTDGAITTFDDDNTGDNNGISFTWSLSGKTLIMDFNGSEPGADSYTIEKLTSTEAVISITNSYDDEGDDIEEYYRMTYKRVNQ